MSEMLVINTEDGIRKPEKLKILSIFDEHFFMLDLNIPVYTDPLPNSKMNGIAIQLSETMKKYHGIGLSANQCGIFKRVFVIGTDQFQLICINPKIIRFSDEKVEDREGCLSFPGLTLNVTRSKQIDVEFLDVNGNLQQLTMDGLTARCFQHELEHLNGIVFTDHFVDKPVALRLARQKQAKLIKKVTRKS